MWLQDLRQRNRIVHVDQKNTLRQHGGDKHSVNRSVSIACSRAILVLLTRINEVVIDVRGTIHRFGHGYLVIVNVVLYPLGDFCCIEDRGRFSPRRISIHDANILVVYWRTMLLNNIFASLGGFCFIDDRGRFVPHRISIHANCCLLVNRRTTLPDHHFGSLWFPVLKVRDTNDKKQSTRKKKQPETSR